MKALDESSDTKETEFVFVSKKKKQNTCVDLHSSGKKNKDDTLVLHIMKRLDSSETEGLFHSFTQANTADVSTDVE